MRVQYKKTATALKKIGSKAIPGKIQGSTLFFLIHILLC